MFSLQEESAHFGRRLKILRAVLDLNQAELDSELDMPGGSTSRIELGQARQISIHALLRLMAFLGRHKLGMDWFTAEIPLLRGLGSPASPSAGDALPAPAVPAEKSPEP
jgi:transcriptional regulator with XRE-family HTH domain